MAIRANLDPPSEPTLEEALAALRASGNVPQREGPDKWKARCTAHDDHAPSMALTRGTKRPLMLYCRSKDCAYPDMLAGIFPDRPRAHEAPLEPRPTRKTLIKTYAYADELGEVLYEVMRYEPKDFRQRRPDGRGGWVYSLGETRRVLYGLPRVLEAVRDGEPVYIVEGEKDADRILELGAVATTMAQGAAFSTRTDEARAVLEALRGCILAYIIADLDGPGRSHARRIAAILDELGVPHELRQPALELDKADVSDHLDAGKALHDLELMQDAPQDPPELETPEGGIQAPEEGNARGGRVYSRKAITYGIERVHWLHDFEGYIPRGMVTLAAGLPGLGKSMLVCYLAAQESRAGRTVCIAAAEDSIEHVLIPRLVAARADLNLVEFIGYEDEHGDGALHLPEHGHMLREAVAQCSPSLFMVDPIGSFLGRAVDAWKDTDVRQALGPFKSIAEENACSCILVAHLNKGTGPFLKRISNSAAFGQFVRSGLLFGRDPDDPDREKGNQRILVSGKLNVGAMPDARCYRVETAHIPSHDGTPPDIATARLIYTGKSPHSTEDLLAASERPTVEASPETKEAMLMLAELLNDGAVPRARVSDEAKKWGISMKPVYNAAERLSVVMEAGGFQQGTTWRLPS